MTIAYKLIWPDKVKYRVAIVLGAVIGALFNIWVISGVTLAIFMTMVAGWIVVEVTGNTMTGDTPTMLVISNFFYRLFAALGLPMWAVFGFKQLLLTVMK